MRRTAMLACAASLIVLLGAAAPAWPQQPAPATKVTALMKQVLADLPGREVVMVTLDIPPGGGSPPHRHPGHHFSVMWDTCNLWP
jgi:quercetin dioxygenase-like cupin family protein